LVPNKYGEDARDRLDGVEAQDPRTPDEVRSGG
jgi:hypothetical protein